MSEENTNEAVDRVEVATEAEAETAQVEVEIEAEAEEVQFDRETLSDYLSMAHRS